MSFVRLNVSLASDSGSWDFFCLAAVWLANDEQITINRRKKKQFSLVFMWIRRSIVRREVKVFRLRIRSPGLALKVRQLINHFKRSFRTPPKQQILACRRFRQEKSKLLSKCSSAAEQMCYHPRQIQEKAPSNPAIVFLPSSGS